VQDHADLGIGTCQYKV